MRIGILQRYLMATLIKATLVVLLIACAVDIFIEFANEIKSVGHGGYTVLDALLYVPMIVPSDLYSLFPMVGLLGVLIGLGALASSNELLVMRASGMSLFDILQAVFISAIIIGAVALSVGEILAPKLSLQANHIKQEAITGNQVVETREGTWIHVGDDFLNISRILDRERWLGVTRYHFNQQNQLLVESWAQRVEYRNNHWLAFSVNETQLFDDHTIVNHLNSQIWAISLTPDALAYGFDDAQEMSLLRLQQFIHYREEAKLPLNHYSLDFWQRVFQPLAMLVMMLLAIPFVFVAARSGTLGLRVLIGVMVSMSFYLLSQLFGQISIVYRVPAWIGALLPILLFLVLSIYLLRRSK